MPRRPVPRALREATRATGSRVGAPKRVPHPPPAGARTVRAAPTAPKRPARVNPSADRVTSGVGPWSVVVVLSVLVVVAAALAGVTVWREFGAGNRAEAIDRAGRQAVMAAERDAQVILSYDYRRIDADISNAKQRTTGQFAKDYADTSRALVSVAKRYRVAVRATVLASAVVRAKSDEVVVLVFVNQSTQSTRIQGAKVDQGRVRMTMRRVGTDWRVAKVDAL